MHKNVAMKKKTKKRQFHQENKIDSLLIQGDEKKHNINVILLQKLFLYSKNIFHSQTDKNVSRITSSFFYKVFLTVKSNRGIELYISQFG